MKPAQTIDLWRRSKFEWGVNDCILATCDHIKDQTGVDPAKPWRGMYATKAEAETIFAPYGGVLALFKHGMALAGFRMTDHIKDGFPVVCDVGGHEVAGIYIGNRVAFMAERGCVEMRAKVLGAWAL